MAKEELLGDSQATLVVLLLAFYGSEKWGIQKKFLVI
jgi:hypothetical protein